MTESSLPVLYLGPTIPRWQPRTLADVQTVLDGGDLAERRWLDAKREIGTSPASKKELARDVASFANGGGVLVIGVEENKETGAFTLAPQPLSGVPEMIEQVVRSRCDPPVFVQCHPIADPADPTRGVLIVEVPASSLAPHMVEGQYYGRGDKTKYMLADAEVERLHAVRRTRQANAEELIEREIARDPFPVDHQVGVRLYAVAQPTASPPELLTENLHGFVIHPLIEKALAAGASNTWQQMITVEARANGLGWSSRNLHSRRWTGQSYGESDLEVWDDGTLTLFADAMSSNMNSQYREQHFVRMDTVLGMVRSLVQLAGAIGAQFGYAGRWELAVGVTGLAGLPAGVQGRDSVFIDLDELVVFSEDRYIAGTMATTVELSVAPGVVTRRLLMRFARAFDVLDRFEVEGYFGLRPQE